MRHNGKIAQADAITMQADAVLAQADATTMQADAAPAQTDASTMQANAASAQADASTMQADAASAQPSARSRRHPTAYRNNASIEQRLLAAQVAIEGVLTDARLQSAFAPYGYDLTRMLEGKALRDQAQALAQQQRARAGDQRRATNTRDAAQAQAHTFYMQQVVLARVALRDDRGAAQTLDLGTRKRTLAGWLMQAQQFYANALNDAAIQEKLATYGVTREQLELGQSKVIAVATGVVAHQQRKGVKQETMRARNAALAALDRWMRDFNAIARVALAERP
jgi:hypothetical protein